MASRPTFLLRPIDTAARFRADRRGAFALIFALSLVPITFVVGAAVDYSRATNLLAHLQAATDGTGLKLCQLGNKASKKDLEDLAQSTMSSYFGTTPFTIEKVKATSNPRTVEIETKAVLPTAVLRAFGPKYSEMPVEANARCFGEPQTFEIALVLDTTGSMSQSSGGKSKMDAMKDAGKKFVDAIFDHPVMSKNAKISLVPFAASVAVNPNTYKSASWIDQDGNASHHWATIVETKAAINAAGVKNRLDVFKNLKAANSNWDWAGCVESAAYPFNVKDDAPTSGNPDSYYVPMWAADESGDGGQFDHNDSGGKNVKSYNSYINDTPSGYCQSTNDETLRTVRGCKYLKPTNAQHVWSPVGAMTGPNAACTSRPLTRLTHVKTTLRDEITALQPLGSTNIHEGFMWGWRTISPKSVFAADAAVYGKDYNNKIIVLMTDGMNMWTLDSHKPILKSLYSSYGYFQNANGSTPNNRLPPANANPSNDTQARAAMDALTREACTNAKASPHKVVIYTVGFSVLNHEIDTQGLELLKSCASSDGHYFKATSSDEIVAVFEKIALSIGNLRLTR